MLRFTKTVKCLPYFEYFYCILVKNRKFISKINRSKVTDYAALISSCMSSCADPESFFRGGPFFSFFYLMSGSKYH